MWHLELPEMKTEVVVVALLTFPKESSGSWVCWGGACFWCGTRTGKRTCKPSLLPLPTNHLLKKKFVCARIQSDNLTFLDLAGAINYLKSASSALGGAQRPYRQLQHDEVHRRIPTYIGSNPAKRVCVDESISIGWECAHRVPI